MRKVHVLLAAAGMGLLTMAGESDASACGGCFTPPETPTVVTDHRMILSIAKQQSTLYDQISYAGDPSSFAWVLPISGSVTVGLSADIVFQSLDQLTQTAVLPPPRNCPAAPICPSDDRGGSLSAAAPNESADGGVAVTKREVVGPYDTVQLHATDPTALQTWLAQNGFSLPDDVKPVVTNYVDEHFDFLALKLLPGKGVKDMRPVRVTSTGASAVLPLRMVAAGTGAVVGISLWVVGEGRYEPQNFPTFSVLPGDLAWDWTANKSNYLEIRAQKATENNGRAWEVESSLTVYRETLEGQIRRGAPPFGQNGGSGSFYEDQAKQDYAPITDANGTVTKTAEQVRDEDLTTLFAGVTTTGRTTRMRSDLAHAALDKDLIIAAAGFQDELSNIRQVTKELNQPLCPVYTGCQQTGTAPRDQAAAASSGSSPETFSCNTALHRTESKWLGVGGGALLALAVGLVLRRRR